MKNVFSITSPLILCIYLNMFAKQTTKKCIYLYFHQNFIKLITHHCADIHRHQAPTLAPQSQEDSVAS